MIILESMPDGYLYSNILLKLYLRSLKFEGKLMFNEIIPYNSIVLAQITKHSVGVVEKALKIFKELGLIEILDNGAIFMLDIQNFIGKSSTEADRKREYRQQIELEKGKILIGQMSDKYPPEKEKEKDKDKELNNYRVQNSEEVLNVPFNFQIVINQINICYKTLIKEPDLSTYTVNDYINIFKYFYDTYKAHTGQEHPQIKNNQVRKVMKELPYIESDRLGLESVDIDPDDYEILINSYFEQPWKSNINSTILHFISGDIRALRYFETMY